MATLIFYICMSHECARIFPWRATWCYQSARRGKQRKKFSETRRGRGWWQRRGKQRGGNSLFRSLFPASRSTRRERSLMQLQLRATFILVSRESIPPPPLHPSFFFLLLILLLFLFSLRFLRLSVRHSSRFWLARGGGSFHPRLRTLALNDASYEYSNRSFTSSKRQYPSH